MANTTEQPTKPHARRRVLASLLTWFLRLIAFVCTCLAVAAIALSVKAGDDSLGIYFQPSESVYKLSIERHSTSLYSSDGGHGREFGQIEYSFTFVFNRVFIDAGRVPDWGASLTQWHAWGQQLALERNRAGELAMLHISLHLGLFVGLLLVLPSMLVVGFVRRSIRTRRQARLNLCANCDYNLTGNESGVCPECGGEICF